MTPAAQVAGRRKAITREQAIQELRDYAELYGPDFTTAAFNPSTAKWRDDPVSRERYLKGNTLRGRPWYSLNTLKKAADGKWNELRVAAGLEANRPGPSKRKREAHKHAPVRGVDDRVRVRTVERVVTVQTTDPRALRVAQKRAEKAMRDHEKVNARLRVARDRIKTLKDQLRKAEEKAERAKARADRAAVSTAGEDQLREELRDAEQRALRMQGAADGLRQALEAADGVEAGLRRELDQARERLALTDEDELEAQRREVAEARARVRAAKAEAAAAEQEATEERGSARRALARAAKAETEATLERARRTELQQATTGTLEPLSSSELEELRAEGGPVGLAPFTEAVKQVLKATGARPRKVALRKVATAAMRWADRL